MEFRILFISPRGWASKNKVLKISSDEASIPTSTEEIVKATLILIDKNVTGLFHLTNSDYCSRYELSRFVLEVLNMDNIVIPVPMSSFKTKAKRPSFTVMSNEKLSKTIGYVTEYYGKNGTVCGCHQIKAQSCNRLGGWPPNQKPLAPYDYYF